MSSGDALGQDNTSGAIMLLNGTLSSFVLKGRGGDARRNCNARESFSFFLPVKESSDRGPSDSVGASWVPDGRKVTASPLA